MVRKETPDVLSEIMGSKPVYPANNKEVLQEKLKEIKQENNNQEDVKFVDKEKTTFNLSVSTLEKLEDTWINLKRQIKDKGRITKTLIVERAIELAIKEWEENGNNSALFQGLSNQ